MIIYALHAICRAINRTRAAKATPPLSDYFTTRLFGYSYLGMHNSLQINGLRLRLRLRLRLQQRLLSAGWPHKMLGKYVQGWGPKCHN